MAAEAPPILPARRPIYRQRFVHSAQVSPAATNGLMMAQSMKTRTSKKEKGTPDSIG